MPFRVEGAEAFGPGVYDMKASLIMIEAALGAIGSLGLAMPRPLTVLFTSDEEIGSLRSRDLIEDEAKKCEFTLVVEPPLANGALKTWRKGTGLFTLTVEGKRPGARRGRAREGPHAPSSSLAPPDPRPRVLQRPRAGDDPQRRLGQRGMATNVVPAHAVARIDGARVSTMTEAAAARGRRSRS